MKIHIIPNIPKPTDGEFKCYWHKIYPCHFIEWTDDLSTIPTKSIVIVKTPTNIDF
jgi:hypothetical protein